MPISPLGENPLFSGIDAFKAVGVSLYQSASSSKYGQMEGRSYIQIKTNSDGVKTAYSTDNPSEAASFAELTSFVDKTLHQSRLSPSDKIVMLKVLGYEKENVTLHFWDKIIQTDKKKAIDLANKLESENQQLLDSASLEDLDVALPPVFSDEDEIV